jgi:hypothetical protein
MAMFRGVDKMSDRPPRVVKYGVSPPPRPKGVKIEEPPRHSLLTFKKLQKHLKGVKWKERMFMAKAFDQNKAELIHRIFRKKLKKVLNVLRGWYIKRSYLLMPPVQTKKEEFDVKADIRKMAKKKIKLTYQVSDFERITPDGGEIAKYPIYVKGTHSERMYDPNTNSFTSLDQYEKNAWLVISSDKPRQRIRGIVTITLNGIIGYNRYTHHPSTGVLFLGRAICVWDDVFNPLFGTLLAEYRLLRQLKKAGLV